MLMAQLVRNDLLGKSGEVIEYSTIERIKYYSDRGYTLLADGFTNGVIFDGDSHVDQNFMVTLRHGTVQVGPDNIQEAGTPINPANPDGAKWPERESYPSQFSTHLAMDKQNFLLITSKPLNGHVA